MIFKTEISSYRTEFANSGYVLIRNALSQSFLSHLLAFYERSAAGQVAELSGWRFPGKKRQFIFDFPPDGAAEEFRIGIAGITGLETSRITISERHLKQYDDTAVEYPAPHKDRYASGISVGIPICLSPETSVCVFPSLDRSENTSESAVYLTDHGLSDVRELYERHAVKLCEAVGDLIVFQGSSIFHERIKPRGTGVLYIKLNDRGEDPLGENVFSAPKLSATP